MTAAQSLPQPGTWQAVQQVAQHQQHHCILRGVHCVKEQLHTCIKQASKPTFDFTSYQVADARCSLPRVQLCPLTIALVVPMRMQQMAKRYLWHCTS
jgi:hypothetical protein